MTKCITINLPSQLPSDSFWKALNILLTKPHVINKRLWGSKIWFKHSCSLSNNYSAHTSPDTLRRLSNLVTAENIEVITTDILNQLCLKQNSKDGEIIDLVLAELLPKTYSDSQAYQLICSYRNKCTVTFYNVTPEYHKQNLCPDFTFSLHFDGSSITLSANTDEESKSYLWLVNTLLPQFVKWTAETIVTKPNLNICNESLSLVSKTKYYDKYNILKEKYGKEMVKIWPECTDPSKFVYEDVAISAYLLLIWESDSPEKKQKFVDLGCGNGLLVYILTQEGHIGLGLDVRKRNIWDMYPENIKLEEKTITPSDTSIFPEMDWIIGNHSDELTPWIPVIAAKSSYNCNFFLLPCCSYNFDGTKYQRKNSNKSQYYDYLDYIQQLCVDCGFKVATDRLKIPSTKRICLVSSGRLYANEEHDQYSSIVDELINNNADSSGNTNVEKDFKAREPVERVRNCTQIDKKVIESIVNRITRFLLEGCSITDPEWSIGKSAEINELVQLIPKDQLTILKSECGGVQTLLKNHHHIFQVQSGKVQLRYPKTKNEVNSKSKRQKNKPVIIKLQQRPCWFYVNHPQGCPLKDIDCSYLHVK